jgi:phosphoglycolate phosphatase-like HAD superfamily hydrolase
VIAFVFDLDGTLLDLPVDIDAVRAAAAAPLEARGFAGELRPILATIEEAAAAVARDEGDRRALVRAARDAIDAGEVDAARRASIRPGAERALRAARAAGFALGILTNNGRPCVAPALGRARLAELVADAPIITRDDVALPKPDPEGLVRMSRLLMPRGGTLVFVGDGLPDIEAGARAREVLGQVALHTVFVGTDVGTGASHTVAGLDELAAEIDAGIWLT